MSKFIKNHIIAELESELEGCSELLVVDMSKMSGTDANEFRVQLGQKDIRLLTVKNSLARRACESLGIQGLTSSLTGPSTLIWGGEDIVALSREITKWAKDVSTLEIKGGAVEGQSLDADGVDRLSKSPGRPELLSQIAGLILSPGGNLVGALLGPGGLVAGAIKSKADGEGE
ncbi:50S ribosomal protein L10 [bacterium]|nr:50S ribosomal protein L10 [bacterium]